MTVAQRPPSVPLSIFARAVKQNLEPLANGGTDPINAFPIGPRNDDASAQNNYNL